MSCTDSASCSRVARSTFAVVVTMTRRLRPSARSLLAGHQQMALPPDEIGIGNLEPWRRLPRAPSMAFGGSVVVLIA
jgi:hypothetical protein